MDNFEVDKDFLVDVENNKLEEVEEILNPFKDVNSYAYRYWDYYKQLQNKDNIQKLYNIGKITKEEFTIITGDEPNKKVIPSGTTLDNLVKTNNLEVTTGEHDFSIFMNQMDTLALADTTSFQDMTLFEMQLLIMNLESRINELENNLGGN